MPGCDFRLENGSKRLPMTQSFCVGASLRGAVVVHGQIGGGQVVEFNEPLVESWVTLQ